MFKKILVPLDGSSLAEKALPFATAEAKAHGASLVLLRVAPLTFFGGPVNEVMKSATEATKEWAGKRLTSVAETLKKDEVDVKCEVGDGDPAKVILDVAEAEKCDLIVMTTLGFSGMECSTLGSVADKVAKACNIPMLLIRAFSVAISAMEAEAKAGV